MLLLGIILTLLGLIGILITLTAVVEDPACRRCGHSHTTHAHYTARSWCAHRGCECPSFRR